MKVFKIIINCIFNVILFAGLGLVWLVFNLDFVEKILFTILFIALVFLRKIYSSFKEFVFTENNRIKLFTDHILKEYNEVQVESVEDEESQLVEELNDGF